MYCTRCGVCNVQVCHVYCTRCTDCIVQCVRCVWYKVFSVYFTSKSRCNQEDFDIKSNLSNQIHFFYHRNPGLVQYQDGLYVFKAIGFFFGFFLCVLHKVCNVNLEDFEIKSILTKSYNFSFKRNSCFVQYKKGSLRFENNCFMFFHFHLQSCPNILFPADHFHQNLLVPCQ